MDIIILILVITIGIIYIVKTTKNYDTEEQIKKIKNYTTQFKNNIEQQHKQNIKNYNDEMLNKNKDKNKKTIIIKQKNTGVVILLLILIILIILLNLDKIMGYITIYKIFH